ncbi:MAG: 4-alpha-glucanotransferase [Clostridia bacterium]|nr:4-alpha-glucanotransferase [Clostridia bacterium]
MTKTNTLANFGFKRKSGILMHVSSLPSPYGIGNFGKHAYQFVDFLSQTGQKCWQVLPLNPTTYGDSPYQSPAALAGNPYFIDPELLYEQKLLTKKELKLSRDTSVRVDYGKLFNTRYELLRKAYNRYKADDKFFAFCRKNKKWLEDYSLFMALKVKYNHCHWTLWQEQDKNATLARKNATLHKEEMDFWKWIQFVFKTQWDALKDYAHQKGILIIGDMPIYVAHDSVDVWKDPSQFLLDDDYVPTVVAGCPPDPFSKDGQLWGNPIYDWEKMKQQGFSWWIERVKESFKLYDILRIDHFRGFSSFYSIPYGEPNAVNGRWNTAFGKELFDAVKKAVPKAKIIAEDLGFVSQDVRELLQYTGFPGMKILQFAFGEDDAEYLPRMYKTENCIVYSGSHDSDCTTSWHQELDERSCARLDRECWNVVGQTRTYDVIELGMKSIANLAVVPMQDYLNLTNEQGRMNVPSVPDGNWQWRANAKYITPVLTQKVADMTKKCRRFYNGK